jgi:hypothetical protein
VAEDVEVKCRGGRTSWKMERSRLRQCPWCPVRLDHLSARPHLSLSSRSCLPRRVHEQIPIASSFCSPTPALSTTLAAHSAVPAVHAMYANDVEGDFFLRAWQIINEISDQLAHNQKFTTSLHSQADSVKVRSRNWPRSSSFHPCTPHRKGRSR